MKINIKNWKQPSEWLKKIQSFWIAKIVWIFIALLIFSAAYLFYVWYFFVFNFSWSEDKKQEYLNIHGKDITLDENKFNEVADEFSKRKEKYDIKSEPVKDIFQIK
jgi:hypothetical protein